MQTLNSYLIPFRNIVIIKSFNEKGTMYLWPWEDEPHTYAEEKKRFSGSENVRKSKLWSLHKRITQLLYVLN